MILVYHVGVKGMTISRLAAFLPYFHSLILEGYILQFGSGFFLMGCKLCL